MGKNGQVLCVFKFSVESWNVFDLSGSDDTSLYSEETESDATLRMTQHL